jgi:hypothetical protein
MSDVLDYQNPTTDNPVATAPVQSKGLDPYDLLKERGGPSREQISVMKAQTPNGKIKLFTLDGGERIYLLRAVSMLEMSVLTKQIRGADQETIARELPLLVVAKCCVWTNTTQSTKLTADELKTGAAGIPSTLYSFIELMSDFVDPQHFEILSTDL